MQQKVGCCSLISLLCFFQFLSKLLSKHRKQQCRAVSMPVGSTHIQVLIQSFATLPRNRISLSNSLSLAHHVLLRTKLSLLLIRLLLKVFKASMDKKLELLQHFMFDEHIP